MKYIKVTSNESPEQVQLLQGKKLINIDVTESIVDVDGESIATFTCTQLAVDVNADTDNAVLQYRADVAQQYLNETDLYMTVDKCAQLTPERVGELTAKREAARVAIRVLTD